jgi:hypothetical protein
MAQIKIVGLDVFVRHEGIPALPAGVDLGPFELKVISNRGTKVWPGNAPKIHLTDVFTCRFVHKGAGAVPALDLLGKLEKLGFEWVHIEKLLEIDGKPGFAVAQGE